MSGEKGVHFSHFWCFFLRIDRFSTGCKYCMQQFLLFATICKVTRVQVFFIAFVIRLCTPFRVIVITLVLMCKIQYILTFASTPWWCANTSYINTFEYSWLQLRWKMLGVRCAAVQDCDDDENTFWICRLESLVEILTLISGRAKISS